MTSSTDTRPLAGRGAFVTGGSRGIGRAIVSRLVADGAAVVFSYAERADAAAELVAELTARGGRVRALRLDVAEQAAFAPVFAEVHTALAEAGRGLDVLVASAGVIEHAPIDEVDEAMWERVFAINARGTFRTIQHGARLLREGGRIVAVSTVGTSWPSAGESVYAASKAAVEQLCRVASRELGGRRITVNTVAPGPTDTDLLRAGASQQALDGAAAITALGRIGQPEDIAGVVALLAHPSSGWLTGQHLRADGGLS